VADERVSDLRLPDGSDLSGYIPYPDDAKKVLLLAEALALGDGSDTADDPYFDGYAENRTSFSH